MADEECELCAKQSGHFDLSRLCCALRLLESTPPGDQRRAMAAHLAMTLSDEAWTALKGAAIDRGLVRTKVVE